MDTVTLFRDQPYAVDDQLEMTVLFIIGEWCDYEKRDEVYITIKMKTPQIEDEITVSSENRHLVWHDYEIEYLGGWLKAVQFKVKRTGK